MKREARSKKFSWYTQPAKLEQTEKIAYMRDYSTNQLLNIIIDEYLEQHTDELAEFDKKYPNGIQ